MKVSVLGCGRWGSCIAWYLDKIGHDVISSGLEDAPEFIRLRDTHKNDYLSFPESIRMTSDLKTAVGHAEVIVISISSQHLRSYMTDIAKNNLDGKTIGVQLGTTGDIYVSDPENVKDAKVERFSKGADAVLALTQKKVDAVVIDNEPAKKFVEQNPGTKILDEPFENEEYAICLKQGSDLTEEFNKALKELKDDGTVQKIIDKYIKAS